MRATVVLVAGDADGGPDEERDDQPDEPDVHGRVVVAGGRLAEHDELGNVVAEGEVAGDHDHQVEHVGEVERADDDLVRLPCRSSAASRCA